MNIVGWILIFIGVLAFLGGLAIALNEQFKRKPESPRVKFDRDFDLKSLGELVDKLTKLLEQFAKLSTGIQWAILGLVAIAVGANLIG